MASSRSSEASLAPLIAAAIVLRVPDGRRLQTQAELPGSRVDLEHFDSHRCKGMRGATVSILIPAGDRDGANTQV